MTHTPGHWKTNSTYDYIAVQLPNRDEVLICSLEESPFRESQSANARLIAAAPDLLEACRLAMPLTVDEGEPFADDYLADVQAALVKAIAKAEGKEES